MNIKRIVIALLTMLACSSHLAAQNPSLTDEQKLGVLFAANQAEMAAGDLALRTTRSASVRVFATRIVSEHAQVNQEIIALTQRFATQPQRSATSDALQRQSNDDLARLDDTSMYDFDPAYLDREVIYLQRLIDTVDDYIRATRSADVRMLLIRARPSFILQLDQAHQLQLSIGSPGLRR
jgi:putative membrane protein